MLTVGPGGYASNSNLSATLNLTNQGVEQSSPIVSVRADLMDNYCIGDDFSADDTLAWCGNWRTMALATMSVQTAPLYGVANGYRPLEIVEPY